MEYSKKDDVTLAVTKPVEVKEETKEYDLDFLKQQEVDILKQMNDFVDARKVELEEVRELLLKAEELGVRSKVEVALEAETARETVDTAEIKSL